MIKEARRSTLESRWCGTQRRSEVGVRPLVRPNYTLCHPVIHRGKPLLVNTAIAPQHHLVALSAPIWVANSRTPKHLFPWAGCLVTKRDTSIISATTIKGVGRERIKRQCHLVGGFERRRPSRVLPSKLTMCTWQQPLSLPTNQHQ